MMSKPHSIDEIDIRKEIEDFPGIVVSAKRIRMRIERKYGLYLNQHQANTLGRRVADILSEMYDDGLLSIYSRSYSRRAIKYMRNKR